MIARRSFFAAGTLIGREIGRRMDEEDRACVGEILERAGTNQPVEWPSADQRTTYRLVPSAPFERDGRECRTFVLQATESAGTREGAALACRGNDRVWRVID